MEVIRFMLMVGLITFVWLLIKRLIYKPPHQCVWVKQDNTYAPPSFKLSDFKITGTETLRKVTNQNERALCGVTTVLWECRDCLALRKEVLLGKVAVNGSGQPNDAVTEASKGTGVHSTKG